MQIYIHRDGQQFGPYSLEQAQDYLRSGDLLAEDLAWHEGAADWMPLAGVVGVAPVAALSSVGAPTQGSVPAWVPPRRTEASFSSAARSAPGGGDVATSSALAERGPTNPGGAPSGNVVRRRRSSSSNNGFRQGQRAMGLRNMLLGALFCLGGTAVTVFSYEVATSDSGHGVYLVTWGAIIFGGIRFLKGLMQFCKA